MIDVDHSHHDLSLENLIDDPELPVRSGIQTFESTSERLSDSIRVLRQRTTYEFQAGDGRGFGQSESQRSSCRRCAFDTERQRGRCPASRMAEVTSSRE